MFLRSGQLAVYETVPTTILNDPLTAARPILLLLKFVRVASQAFDIQRSEETEKSILAEQRKISRQLLPFVTSPVPGTNYSGVFLTGDRPCWILSTDKGAVKIFPSGNSVVHAFTACSVWESKGDFLVYSEEVACLMFFCLCWSALTDALLGSKLDRMDARCSARRTPPNAFCA